MGSGTVGVGEGGLGVPLELEHASARVERGGDVAAEEDGGHAARAEPPRERQRGEEEREQVAAPRGKATRDGRARARASRPRPGQLERWCAGARSIAKSRQPHAAHGQAREYEILVCLMRCYPPSLHRGRRRSGFVARGHLSRWLASRWVKAEERSDHQRAGSLARTNVKWFKSVVVESGSTGQGG